MAQKPVQPPKFPDMRKTAIDMAGQPPPAPYLGPTIGPQTSADMQANMPQATIRAPFWWERVRDGIAQSPLGTLFQTMDNIHNRITDSTSSIVNQPLPGNPQFNGQPLTVGDAMNLHGAISPAMTLFHGSPHSFDSFDMSKIGTGEGAAAYGHGLYFAENPAVATSYRPRAGVYVDGKHIDPTWMSLGELAEQVKEPFKNTIKDPYMATKADTDQTDRIFALHQFLDEVSKAGSYDGAVSNIKNEMAKMGTTYPEDMMGNTWFQKMLDVGTEYKPRIQGAGKRGHMYEVDVPDEHVDQMLDWDRPMKEQPVPVQKAFGRDFPYHTGRDLYEQLTKHLGSQKAASDYLLSHGIPGLKYLDAFSRNPGNGTRNIVVFDPSVIKSVKRQ